MADGHIIRMDMTEAIKNFIVQIFGDNAWLGIIIIAMIPIIELRGAIPFALSSVWGAGKLSAIEAYFCSVIGATIPAIAIIPLLIPFFEFLKKTRIFKKFVGVFEDKFSRSTEKIETNIANETSRKKVWLKKFVGVMTFVAVPLPLTGAWTGSAVAAYLKMSFWEGLLAILIGNMISGLIMTSLCVIFPSFVDMILYVFLALVVVIVFVTIAISFFKRRKEMKTIEKAE